MTMAGSERSEASFDELFAKGTGLLQSGKPLEAVVLLQRANEAEPDHFDAALNLSGAYILSGKFSKAVPLLERLSQVAPENEMVWINLGAAYLGNPVLARDEERFRAIAAFKRAYEINPAANNVAYNIGLVYRDQNDIEEAIFWFGKAVEMNPDDRHAQRMLRKLADAEDGIGR
jgi:tetratricopeptide (TPR) repeat protein